MRPLTARQAIKQSIQQDEIVTIDGDEEREAELWAACDDSADVRRQYGVIEFWGTLDGKSWRVHMRANIPDERA